MTLTLPTTATPDAAPPRRLVLIANRASGSQPPEDLAKVAEALRAKGCTVDVREAEQPTQLGPLAKAAIAERPDAVVAFGGDGTVNAVAHELAGSGAAGTVAFGIVPQGTFNYVARQYGIPAEPEAVADTLAVAPARPIGLARVNGRVFLNNASIGLYTDIIDARERHKARFGRYRLVAALSALVTALRSESRIAVALEADGRAVFTGRASLVFVGVNPAQLKAAGLDPSKVEGGALGVVVVKAVSAMGILKMLFGALMGRLAEIDEVEPLHARELVIRTRRPNLRVVMDGEVLKLQSPLTLAFERDGLRLLAPLPPGDESVEKKTTLDAEEVLPPAQVE